MPERGEEENQFERELGELAKSYWMANYVASTSEGSSKEEKDDRIRLCQQLWQRMVDMASTSISKASTAGEAFSLISRAHDIAMVNANPRTLITPDALIQRTFLLEVAASAVIKAKQK